MNKTTSCVYNILPNYYLPNILTSSCMFVTKIGVNINKWTLTTNLYFQ